MRGRAPSTGGAPSTAASTWTRSSERSAAFDARGGRRRSAVVSWDVGPRAARSGGRMRIATWNVNSLKARLEKVAWWIERARPDVLLMQETKLADADAPADVFRGLGYELAHHGEGRWNGVAIASRCGVADVVTNFGEPLRPPVTPDVPDDEPLAEARMISAVCDGVRVTSVYAPNGREVDSPFYRAKLAWYERAVRWLADTRDPKEPLCLGGDFNVAPADA